MVFMILLRIMLFYYKDIFIIGRIFYFVREDKLNMEDIVYDVEDILFLMSSQYPPLFLMWRIFYFLWRIFYYFVKVMASNAE